MDNISLIRREGADLSEDNSSSDFSYKKLFYDETIANRLLADSLSHPNLDMLKKSAMLFSAPYDASNIMSESYSQNAEKIYNWEKKTILIAEDEDTNFFYLRAALRKTNIKLIHAHNGKEAVEIMKEKEKDIDLVLMDIKMPEMNGIEATKHIKSMNRKKVVIAQTAYVMEEDRAAYADAGCDDFLAKPISREKLVATLAKYLEI